MQQTIPLHGTANAIYVGAPQFGLNYGRTGTFFLYAAPRRFLGGPLRVGSFQPDGGFGLPPDDDGGFLHAITVSLWEIYVPCVDATRHCPKP